VLDLHHRDLYSVLVSRVDNRGCKLHDKDFKFFSDRLSALTFRLLTLHHRHRKGTTKGRILVLWDHATTVIKMGTMPIDVHASKEIKLQLKA
jgi:hypothetical protein